MNSNVMKVLRILCLPLLCVSGLVCDHDNVPVELSFSPTEACSGIHVKGTLDANSYCKPRLRVLRLPLPNGTDLTQMTPTHVEVARCGGGCHHLQQGCIDRLSRMRIIPVMMAKCGISVGLCDKECASVEVEEHLECGCECSISKQDCSSNQEFHNERCACECKDREEMRNCQESGSVWNRHSCTCECPVTSWRECSLGLVFDNNTCICIPSVENINEIKEQRIERSNDDGLYISWENIIIGILISILILFILLNIFLARNLKCLHYKVKNAQTTIYSTVDKANIRIPSDPFLLDDETKEDHNSLTHTFTNSRRIAFNSDLSERYRSFLQNPRSEELQSIDSEDYIISVMETLPSTPKMDCTVQRLSSFR